MTETGSRSRILNAASPRLAVNTRKWGSRIRRRESRAPRSSSTTRTEWTRLSRAPKVGVCLKPGEALADDAFCNLLMQGKSLHEHQPCQSCLIRICDEIYGCTSPYEGGMCTFVHIRASRTVATSVWISLFVWSASSRLSSRRTSARASTDASCSPAATTSRTTGGCPRNCARSVPETGLLRTSSANKRRPRRPLRTPRILSLRFRAARRASGAARPRRRKESRSPSRA